VEIGSESHCLLGQFERILRISDSEAGEKEEKSGVRQEEKINVKMMWQGYW